MAATHPALRKSRRPAVMALLAVGVLLPLALAWLLVGPARPLPDELAGAAALIGFAALLWSFVLSGRCHAVTDVVGMDRTMRWHQRHRACGGAVADAGHPLPLHAARRPCLHATRRPDARPRARPGWRVYRDRDVGLAAARAAHDDGDRRGAQCFGSMATGALPGSSRETSLASSPPPVGSRSCTCSLSPRRTGPARPANWMLAVIARQCKAAASAGWLFVLCGPPATLHEARRALRALGVLRAHILRTQFTHG